MSTPLSRRDLLKGGAGAGATLLIGSPTSAYARAKAGRLPLTGSFPESVASGFPSTNGVTLWTKVADLGGKGNVGYEVARDADFRQVVHSGSAAASPELGYTIHENVSGRFLLPGEEYFYRFFTGATSSPVGRFRTARPVGSNEPVRIAFFSCQEYIAGFYHAHRDLAAQDVDLVVCLGDYIYERSFADNTSVSQPVRADNTAADGEAETLAEYRRKYSLYQSDPNLLKVREQFPLVAIWDDHEVEDNYAANRPGGATENREIPFSQRMTNGYRAFFENMPRAIRTDGRIYGSVPLGNAEVFLLDTRQYRDDQPCNPNDSALSQPCPPSVTDDPSRTLLGATQKRWLKDRLSASRATWKIIANQVMIMSLDAPPQNTLNTDSWDGYGAERRELIDFISNPHNRVGDVAFVTGDIHTFFAGDVYPTGRELPRGTELSGPPRATEFVGGAITSPGIVDRLASEEAQRLAVSAGADALVLGNNPHISYSNQAYKGYSLLTTGTERLEVRYRAVRDTRKPESDTFELRRFSVVRGRPVVIDEGGPVPLPAPGAPGPLPASLLGARAGAPVAG